MPLTHTTTPRADGFIMPAEFAPHTCCWMLFPHRADNWRENAQPAQAAWVEVATAIAQFEPVIVGASAAHYARARQMMPPEVRVIELSSDDAWMRDCGVTFVQHPQSGELRGVDWQFNAWGGIYADWAQDSLVAQKMLAVANADRYPAPLVMEGGALHVDGEGTLITTAECLLHPNRNPHLSQTQIESYLQNYLGVEKIIWLPLGVYNDETDGHVDNLACFARPSEIILSWTDDPHDPNYDRFHQAYDTLMSSTDAQNRPFKVHLLPQPDPLYMTDSESAGIEQVAGTLIREGGNRLAASYVNFYMPNSGVILPQFGVAQDDPAKATLAEIFPERRVVGVPSREILLGGGNIHCITQQQPA